MTQEYLVVYEEGEDGTWGAYSPDLPGVYAAAATRTELETLMKEAMEFHIEGLREFGEPVPKPLGRYAMVAVAA